MLLGTQFLQIFAFLTIGSVLVYADDGFDGVVLKIIEKLNGAAAEDARYSYKHGSLISVEPNIKAPYLDVIFDAEVDCKLEDDCQNGRQRCKSTIYQVSLSSYEIVEVYCSDTIEPIHKKEIHSCPGCVNDVNTSAEGTDKFIEGALQHIENERKEKHALINIIKIQRQVVNGILYTFLIEVSPTVCSKEVDKPCAISAERESFICEVKYWSQPWLSKNDIIKNNCTVSQTFTPKLNYESYFKKEHPKKNQENVLAEIEAQIIPTLPVEENPQRGVSNLPPLLYAVYAPHYQNYLPAQENLNPVVNLEYRNKRSSRGSSGDSDSGSESNSNENEPLNKRRKRGSLSDTSESSSDSDSLTSAQRVKRSFLDNLNDSSDESNSDSKSESRGQRRKRNIFSNLKDSVSSESDSDSKSDTEDHRRKRSALDNLKDSTSKSDSNDQRTKRSPSHNVRDSSGASDSDSSNDSSQDSVSSDFDLNSITDNVEFEPIKRAKRSSHHHHHHSSDSSGDSDSDSSNSDSDSSRDSDSNNKSKNDSDSDSDSDSSDSDSDSSSSDSDSHSHEHHSKKYKKHHHHNSDDEDRKKCTSRKTCEEDDNNNNDTSQSSNEDDPQVNIILNIGLQQLDERSSYENRYKIKDIKNVDKQKVFGNLWKVTATVVLSDCKKGSSKINISKCGEMECDTCPPPKECYFRGSERDFDNRTDVYVSCKTNKEKDAIKAKRDLRETYERKYKYTQYELDAERQYNEEQELFNYFQWKYRKFYGSEDEKSRRYKIFKDNLKTIRLLNKFDQGTATYGLTKFADLTRDEFSKLHGLRTDLRSENDIPFPQAKIPDIELPTEFDWRSKNVVTEVKDQGQCGSCWAFSTTGNIEGQYAIKYGKLLEFSEQELVDCDKADDGCNGGLMDNAYRAIENMGGLETEQDYPYEAEDEKCSFVKSKARVRLSGAVNISHDEIDMAKWLVTNGPISIAINANAMQFYMGGVSHPWKFLCSPGNLDHGVLIVGYGVHQYKLFNKTLPYWIVKNSWGTSWGEQGYYRVYRGDGTCGLNQTPSSGIVA